LFMFKTRVEVRAVLRWWRIGWYYAGWDRAGGKTETFCRWKSIKMEGNPPHVRT